MPAGKFIAKKTRRRQLVLSKVNTDARPPIAKANGYITGPDASDYTIQADVMGTSVRDKLPDLGIVNSRYTLLLVGEADPRPASATVRVQSWEGNDRIDVGHRVRLGAGHLVHDEADGRAEGEDRPVRGKVWKQRRHRNRRSGRSTSRIRTRTDPAQRRCTATSRTSRAETGRFDRRRLGNLLRQPEHHSEREEVTARFTNFGRQRRPYQSGTQPMKRFSSTHRHFSAARRSSPSAVAAMLSVGSTPEHRSRRKPRPRPGRPITRCSAAPRRETWST